MHKWLTVRPVPTLRARTGSYLFKGLVVQKGLVDRSQVQHHPPACEALVANGCMVPRHRGMVEDDVGACVPAESVRSDPLKESAKAFEPVWFQIQQCAIQKAATSQRRLHNIHVGRIACCMGSHPGQIAPACACKFSQAGTGTGYCDDVAQ